jgi:signal transduction histidine kinase
MKAEYKTMHLLLSDPEGTPAPSLGLKLRVLTHEYERAGCQLSFTETRNPWPLTPAGEEALYSIADALLRAAQQADAVRIELWLEWKKQRVLLSLRHDGQPHLADASHLGDENEGDLRWIETRAHELGGRLTTIPRAGGGAEIVVELPTP